MKDRRISQNFNLSEFGYIEPELTLLRILQQLREDIATPIKITDGSRTVKQHIDIYFKLYGEEWLKHIPWGSKHLPAYGQGLRAVDIKSKKGDEYWRGDMLAEDVTKIAKVFDIRVGLGVGKHFIHIDVRKRDARWKYNY